MKRDRAGDKHSNWPTNQPPLLIEAGNGSGNDHGISHDGWRSKDWARVGTPSPAHVGGHHRLGEGSF